MENNNTRVCTLVHGTYQERTDSEWGLYHMPRARKKKKKRWQMRCLKASALEGILALPTPTSRTAVRLEIEGKKVVLGAVKRITPVYNCQLGLVNGVS